MLHLFPHYSVILIHRVSQHLPRSFEEIKSLIGDFYLDGKSTVPSTPQQQQQSSSSSISSLSSTSNVSLTNPPNPSASPFSITDDPTVESTRLKLAHRLAI